MQLTKDFSIDELKCLCCGLCDMQEPFMENLQKLRDKWARPMLITSGYRCKKHNDAMGGAPGSKHMSGIAVDVMLVGGEERYEFVKLAMSMGFAGVGIATNFVHIDAREDSKALWRYANK